MVKRGALPMGEFRMVPLFRLAALAKMNSPPLILILPLRVLLPERIKLPGPLLVQAVLPAIAALMVAASPAPRLFTVMLGEDPARVRMFPPPVPLSSRIQFAAGLTSVLPKISAVSVWDASKWTLLSVVISI